MCGMRQISGFRPVSARNNTLNQYKPLRRYIKTLISPDYDTGNINLQKNNFLLMKDEVRFFAAIVLAENIL